MEPVGGGQGLGSWHALPCARVQGKHPPEAQPGDAPASRAGARGEEVSAFRAPPVRRPSGESPHGTPRLQWPDRRERGTGPEPREASGRAGEGVSVVVVNEWRQVGGWSREKGQRTLAEREGAGRRWEVARPRKVK